MPNIRRGKQLWTASAMTIAFIAIFALASLLPAVRASILDPARAVREP
jgi:ABC-type lipoprotein release transport system permease subunit